MDAKINYALRDGDAVKGTVDLNRTEMDSNGFEEAVYTALTAAIEDLQIKETSQSNAMETAEDKSALLKTAVQNTRKIINDVKAAVKSAYGKNKRIHKLFKIGENIPVSVKSLISVIQALNIQIDEYKADLLKNGLSQKKINSLIAAPANLVNLEKAKNNAKSVQKSKTVERNAAANVLDEQLYKIRNFAKACFSEKPEILVQFDPIPKGHGGLGNDAEQTPPENTTPPAGT